MKQNHKHRRNHVRSNNHKTLATHDDCKRDQCPQRSFNLIKNALNHGPVTITTKDGNAVLMSEEVWESIKETLYLMGDPDFLRDVEEARNAPESDFEAWN